MTELDDRPTMGERYTAATESANLKLGERRSDVDLIIAAGFVQDSFGLTLHRLMAEFDAVRGPVDAAKRWVSSQMSLAATLRETAALVKDFEHREKAFKVAEQVQKAAVSSLRTEFTLVLSVMKTLREARYAMGSFVIEQARIKRVQIEEEDLRRLAGAVLDVLLDPLCTYCEGRGYNGGGRHEQTGPQAFCRPCRNTGLRRTSIGKDDTERLFASHLLMQMNSEMHEVQRQIAFGLRRVNEAKEFIAAHSEKSNKPIA